MSHDIPGKNQGQPGGIDLLTTQQIAGNQKNYYQ